MSSLSSVLERAVLLAALLGVGCSRHAPPSVREAPRPVEVYELRTVDPVGSGDLTGSVSSWMEQDVAFEVSGRIRYVQEPGNLLAGRWEESGAVRIEGQLLAQLDDRPYAIAVEAAEAEVESAQGNLGVVEAQLETLLPANLRAAEAERDRAEAEYQRYLEAGKTDAVAAVDVQRAKTSRDVSEAKVEQAQGAFVGQAAEKRS